MCVQEIMKMLISLQETAPKGGKKGAKKEEAAVQEAEEKMVRVLIK